MTTTTEQPRVGDPAAAAARLQALGIVDPTDRPRAREHRAAARLSSLSGKRAGFLDNRKANADALLEELRDLLEARVDLAGATWVAKFIYSREATPAELDHLAEHCDFVVTAVGD
jgi:hypothetical protein